MVNRFDIYLVNLDPTIGSEIKKTRPCVVISPNEMNHALNTAIIAPMTTVIRHYPTRIAINFQNKNGEIALDQIRAIDKNRLIKHIGVLQPKESQRTLSLLNIIFSE